MEQKNQGQTTFKPGPTPAWVKGRIFEQKKASQIKQVQFHGSRHRG